MRPCINQRNDKMQNKCTDGNDNTLNGNDIMWQLEAPGDHSL